MESESSGDPQSNRRFESLEEEHLLSKQLKNLATWHPIPITAQEKEAATNEESMSKGELLATINSPLLSINISDHSKYHGLQQKNRNQ
ncbi:6643_t:CDS:2, partial [Scutellospora calospora]